MLLLSFDWIHTVLNVYGPITVNNNVCFLSVGSVGEVFILIYSWKCFVEIECSSQSC